MSVTRVGLVVACLLLLATRPRPDTFRRHLKAARSDSARRTFRQEVAHRLQELSDGFPASAADLTAQLAPSSLFGRHTYNTTTLTLRVTATPLVLFACANSSRASRCYVGALGTYLHVPPKADLWLLAGAHAAACAIAHTWPDVYYGYFMPRRSEPASVLLGAFATSSAWELAWLVSTLLGTGAELQRRAILGRGGFLALYAGGAIASSLCALVFRASPSGAGGALAACTYHCLHAPHARHEIFGQAMGAKQALAVQLGLTCWPAISNGGRRALPTLLMAGLPVAVGAVLYRSRRLGAGFA